MIPFGEIEFLLNKFISTTLWPVNSIESKKNYFSFHTRLKRHRIRNTKRDKNTLRFIEAWATYPLDFAPQHLTTERVFDENKTILQRHGIVDRTGWPGAGLF